MRISLGRMLLEARVWSRTWRVRRRIRKMRRAEAPVEPGRCRACGGMADSGAFGDLGAAGIAPGTICYDCHFESLMPEEVEP